MTVSSAVPDQHRGSAGQQPLGAAGIEAAQRYRPARLQLGDEHRGDQETGDHEEDIDTDEAAGHAEAGMVGQHEEHGNGP